MAKTIAKVESARAAAANHPAIRAWRKLGTRHCVPDFLEILAEQKNERGVYRLVGVGPAGANVIAKKCDMHSADIEFTIYSEILPHLAVSSLRCYASIADDNARYSWLFLEDAGDGEYSPNDKEHRILAGLWLGAMNASAQRLSLPSRLSDRGPSSYLEVLHLARSMTRERSQHPAFSIHHRYLLRAIAEHCEFLEMHWARIEQFCEGIPRTLVHGDLSLWNARIQADQRGQRFLVMDWESAGWGVPAADLAQFAGNALTPDIAAYWSMAKDYWRGHDINDLDRLSGLGTVFRWINAVQWANQGFRESSMDWYITEMSCYEPKLAEWAMGTQCILELK
jgi:hypothetical protein